MKRSLHQTLKSIYDFDDLGVRELSEKMCRRHGDHRDFYGLSALLEAGYIGFTGPIFKTKSGKLDTYRQVRLFQAYSQGYGEQSYDGVFICNSKHFDSFLYIGPKAITYFQSKSEMRNGWLITAALSLIVAIISGVSVAYLTSADTKCCPVSEAHVTSQSSSPAKDAGRTH